MFHIPNPILGMESPCTVSFFMSGVGLQTLIQQILFRGNLASDLVCVGSRYFSGLGLVLAKTTGSMMRARIGPRTARNKTYAADKAPNRGSSPALTPSP